MLSHFGGTFYPSNNNNNVVLPVYYTIQEDRLTVYECENVRFLRVSVRMAITERGSEFHKL
jgi:hypothetical protein